MTTGGHHIHKAALLKDIFTKFPFAAPAFIHLVDDFRILIQVLSMIKSIGTNNPLKEVLIFALNLDRLQILNDFISQLVFVRNIVVDADSTVAIILQSRKIT